MMDEIRIISAVIKIPPRHQQNMKQNGCLLVMQYPQALKCGQWSLLLAYSKDYSFLTISNFLTLQIHVTSGSTSDDNKVIINP
jgi:hypothetical protein